MLNTFKYLPLVVAAAFAVPAAAQSDEEIYEGGVNCGALHSYISGALQDADEQAAGQAFESATRFFMLALVRNEETAENDMQKIVDSLIERIEGMESDTEIEEFIAAGIKRCEAFRESVAEEYDAIEFEDEAQEEPQAEE
ncbi:hypothetical protein QWY75_13165 [Pontixanthobacter aestiaquae]|uniref:HdeA/HdeB family protein n=1 Tax=Pontixanthobacter aestiaquae TaxID=1509367 RepID=A0A844Z2G8_9SPHN|nr:hypothetical protein [Pontixanthobacter aestiaquae]MDN3647156.1 hypothetical protein [Pontixanthobacter aestiaquae]MXO81868.1 hypothetical protein [Pontixanthobacter aestiaquae]